MGALLIGRSKVKRYTAKKRAIEHSEESLTWYILTARDSIESLREVKMRRFQLLRRARIPQRVYIMRKFGSKEVKSVRE
jgi:hypothetical protein